MMIDDCLGATCLDTSGGEGGLPTVLGPGARAREGRKTARVLPNLTRSYHSLYSR